MKQTQHRSSYTAYIPELGREVLFNPSGRAKRLSITIKPDATVRVTFPRNIPGKTAEKFLSAKIPWIRKHLQRIAARPAPPAVQPRPLQPLERLQAGRFLATRLNQLARQYNFTYNRLTIRQQRTRWGSCSDKNNISLNAHLIHLPPELIDYVLLHELLHTRIKNHSPIFWTEMQKLLPDTRTLRKELRNYHCTV